MSVLLPRRAINRTPVALETGCYSLAGEIHALRGLSPTRRKHSEGFGVIQAAQSERFLAPEVLSLPQSCRMMLLSHVNVVF